MAGVAQPGDHPRYVEDLGADQRHDHVDLVGVGGREEQIAGLDPGLLEQTDFRTFEIRRGGEKIPLTLLEAMLLKLLVQNRGQVVSKGEILEKVWNLDPETETRIAQYELAFRMQASVPELTDLSSEPDSTFALYGEEARKKMAEQIERRTKMAEQKIAQAEAAAVKDVRSAASDLAIAAAAQIIDKNVKGAKAASLVDDIGALHDDG